jgi:glycosyltransferase involved in cell wall biosynthesis
VLGRAIGGRLAAQIAISEFVGEKIGEPSKLLYNGVSTQPQAGLAVPVVLMMQRLEREKSPDVALRAWAQSGLQEQGWRLQVAGRGHLETEARRLSTEIGIDSSVDFLGYVTDTQRILSDASIFIASAPEEPFGLSVVEAMAHGLPVVAAGGGGHFETIGDEGLLFPVGDAAAAAKHLRDLAADQRLRANIGTRLRARQQRLFAVDDHIAQLEQLYWALRARS